MYKKLQGKNGLTVIVSPMPQMASVSLGIWIGVGGRYESEKQSGISHLVEHMLFKGTHSRTAKDLKESIEGIGGAFNGFTSDEVTCYMVKVPAKYLELGIDILADMVLNARFDEQDLTRERFVVCEEIKMYRDQPADHVMDLLGEIMWPQNALGRPLTGSISNVKGFSADELIRFKENNYHPANIAVVAAGRADPEKVLSYAAQRFAAKKKRKTPSFETPKVTQKSSSMKVCRGDTKQTHIAMGFHATDRNIRERFALKLMNVIFGGNMSSRLFEELREKYGLCYDISSSYKRHSDVGEVHIHAGVDNKKAPRSVIAILDEVKKLRDLGITEDELARAKEYAKGQFLIAMEGTATRMMWLGDKFMVQRHIPGVKDVLREIDGVTSAEIHKVCERIFRASSVNLAMVGRLRDKDKSKIKEELNRL
ncbi:MAG: insulinase family protein [Candidatus Makaraimicrobium thalassicum]|nr:MAG: insulinase family protein [Candidatus Omnitrophota bacterium]